MAKLAVVVLLALAAVATQAKPLGIGGGVVSKNHVTTSSHIISPHLGLGYGMLGLGYPGVLGKTITHHSTVGHVIPHFGLGLHGKL